MVGGEEVDICCFVFRGADEAGKVLMGQEVVLVSDGNSHFTLAIEITQRLPAVACLLDDAFDGALQFLGVEPRSDLAGAGEGQI